MDGFIERMLLSLKMTDGSDMLYGLVFFEISKGIFEGVLRRGIDFVDGSDVLRPHFVDYVGTVRFSALLLLEKA